jgi:hypothetical protein
MWLMGNSNARSGKSGTPKTMQYGTSAVNPSVRRHQSSSIHRPVSGEHGTGRSITFLPRCKDVDFVSTPRLYTEYECYPSLRSCTMFAGDGTMN